VVPSPLTRTFPTPHGERVELRLAHRGNTGAVRDLLTRRGVDASPLEVRRLLSYDPTKRQVLAAFAPIDGAVTLVGLGAIDLEPDADVDTLVVDDRHAGGVGELIATVLRDRAGRFRRRAA
jgi:hypothetical protein